MSNRLMTAIKFAVQKHSSQYRKDKKTPFVVHPLSVALTVCKISKDEDIIISALLHDIIEDTSTSIVEIESKFGKKVANLVTELTHDMSPNISKIQRKQHSVDNIKKLSSYASIVKYCDILCNMQELLIQINEKNSNITKQFNWSMEEKMDYEFKRLEEFKKHHPTIDTRELEICLEKIQKVIS